MVTRHVPAVGLDYSGAPKRSGALNLPPSLIATLIEPKNRWAPLESSSVFIQHRSYLKSTFN